AYWWASRCETGLTVGGKNWARYSGLFVLLKHNLRLGREAIEEILLKAWQHFKQIVSALVPSQV
ncbi:MAG: hypothetical protein M1370_06285, partial [Bacteroidetes bacterium]|nr:hypothetical protein [Chloroflexota bacterium]MCL4466409.1 hypothetical protein [Chloroflexota bacterium]MCL4534753.1 hypothetical protein [Bacteroidota bacterium]MCL5026224.1 hypothetical protein [Chloroflexota bacterium]MCL5027203.1 hypothetical protein [Chloroflexota bacterium]